MFGFIPLSLPLEDALFLCCPWFPYEFSYSVMIFTEASEDSGVRIMGVRR